MDTELEAFIETAYSEINAIQDFADAAKTLVEGTPNYVYNEWYNINWPDPSAG